MSDTKEEIMDCAESAIRKGGFSAFSFRTIADELGVKSASIHYHFPTKQELVSATTERYCLRFEEAIGDPTSPEALENYVGAYQSVFADRQSLCLCGVLASENALLDAEVRDVLSRFADDNLAWLTRCFENRGASPEQAKGFARAAFAALQGAMTFSGVSGNGEWLDEVGSFVLSLSTND